ncbi:MAG: DUF1566 domain-containing protein [Methylomonas sp.]|nr:DUF1566 domain-containing protein [Methylomonas sp.]
MRHQSLGLAIAVCCALMTEGAQAQLFGRGGGLIYDSALNVTWLADANYAQTSGYDSDGRMNWHEANAWAAGLEYRDTVRNVTYSDWRLPTLTDLGSPGCNYAFSGTDCGYNVDTASSELASLFYGALGNKALVNASGQQQLDHGLIDDPNNPDDESLFSNLLADYYWFGTPHFNTPNLAWSFRLSTGEQYNHSAAGSLMRAWAVRDGDVAAVPLPGAAWLFGAPLLGWLVNRRPVTA